MHQLKLTVVHHLNFFAENFNNFSYLNSTQIAIYQITDDFHKSMQKSPIMCPKIVAKTVYIRKRIKHFGFDMNPQKTFAL